MQQTIDCLIWGKGNPATIQGVWVKPQHFDVALTSDALFLSPRAGGAYRLGEQAPFVMNELKMLSEGAKARLTTWLVNQRRHGAREPVINLELVRFFDRTTSRDSLSMSVRAEMLLRLLIAETENAGDELNVYQRFQEALAWSESTKANEIFFLLKYLHSKGFIVDFLPQLEYGDPCFATVTVEGFGFIEEIAATPDSTQAFVAMWFSEKMAEAYQKGIEPAIREAGYKPMRIDMKLDAEKIDDEIFAEIRRSRFLVADMTHGKEGVRGAVYFEAGFAQGLGLPVIYTCRDDPEMELSFDTRQFFHILWDSPVELRKLLATRILARVGEGPLREESDQD